VIQHHTNNCLSEEKFFDIVVSNSTRTNPNPLPKDKPIELNEDNNILLLVWSSQNKEKYYDVNVEKVCHLKILDSDIFERVTFLKLF
jgi:hypothetical protein